METKNEGMLTSLARTVGTTAGIIVAKTTQLKDEVVKMGSEAVGPSAKKPTGKTAARKPAVKKAKKRVSSASTKKKKTAPKKRGKRA